MEEYIDHNGARLPPKGLSEPEDQGESETCVRFALSKAIANALFVKEKIDVEQSNITACLVQTLSLILIIYCKVKCRYRVRFFSSKNSGPKIAHH